MNDSDIVQVGRPQQFDQMIAAAATAGFVGRVELLRAAKTGLIDYVEPERRAAAPMVVIEQSSRPVLVVLGDDDYAATGPTGWECWQRLSYWTKFALVHATGADVASYRLVIRLALIRRRFLLIETDSSHAGEWGEALQRRRIPTIGLIPPNGPHPVIPTKETLS